MADTQPPMAHDDSVSSEQSGNADKTKQKSRRPANTAFRQQRLKAWQPILTPKTVLPLFFAIGIIFAPIGGLLLYSSAQVQEIILDYSKCYVDAPDYPETALMPSKLVSMSFKGSSGTASAAPSWTKKNISYTYAPGVVVDTIQCTMNFTIPSDMKHPVLFYYRLTNFYQNHRRYAKSFSIDQLKGHALSADNIKNSDCSPLTTVKVGNISKPYYPCGIAANSQFNDTFYNPVLLNPSSDSSSSSNETYVMNSNSGIAWSSDKDLYGKTAYAWSDVAVPPNWVERYPNGYTDDNHPDLKNDEHFQVWMRLAGLPTFSKLAQRNDTHDMVAGTYTVDVDHHFNVTEYGGTKAILISTRTVMGGKNSFLGITYVVVGGICVVLGAIFTLTHLMKPRKLGDHTYLSWNNDAPTAATTSGRDNVLAAES